MKYTIVIVLAAIAIEGVVCKFDKEKMMEIGKKCKEETNPSDDDVKKIMSKETPTSSQAKCMMACIFKNLGLMTDDGLYDVEGNTKIAEEHLADQPEKMAQAKELGEVCKERAMAVTDDGSGCERAAVMHACALEKAQELGYKMD